MSDLADLRQSAHDPTQHAAPDRAEIERLIEAGRHDEARHAVGARLGMNPQDAEGWFLQARILQAAGQVEEAQLASGRAIALWPDVTPVHRLQLELARQTGDAALAIRAVRALLAVTPDDPHLHGEIGWLPCQEGAYAQALPHLRIAVPVLLHENSTVWNYTVALALTGGYRELLDAQPMLDRLAAGLPGPYTPYRMLAAAKLALQFDRSMMVEAQAGVEASPLWLRPMQVLERIAVVVAAGDPFSLVCLDQDLSHFFCATSLHAHLLLRPVELLALGAAAWERWFETEYRAVGPAQLASLAALVGEAVRTADILGMPDAETLRLDNLHFGLLAEMGRGIEAGGGRSFTAFTIARQLHETMPFLRPVLQGQPFLGFVGSTPELAGRLGHFCGIGETRAIAVPPPDRQDAGEGTAQFDRIEQALAELSVPFRGALFLVAVPGPYGLVFCSRIKALGGIALDMSLVAPGWARR